MLWTCDSIIGLAVLGHCKYEDDLQNSTALLTILGAVVLLVDEYGDDVLNAALCWTCTPIHGAQGLGFRTLNPKLCTKCCLVLNLHTLTRCRHTL